jgi:hypothetical protein
MKTKVALAFYYLAIGFLTICAGVIVVKLIFWPPCTPTGNTCVVEPWSVAGLAGTVLAVAATVLAVLGAVAVAAWWTSLNERVVEQVKRLYEAQKKEVNTQVDTLLKDQKATIDAGINALLKDQQTKVDIQFRVYENLLVSIRSQMADVQATTELANDLIKQTFERAEKQVAQLLQTDLQATGVLARMQQREAMLEEIHNNYREAIDTWEKLSKGMQLRLAEEAAKQAGNAPNNGASS